MSLELVVQRSLVGPLGSQVRWWRGLTSAAANRRLEFPPDEERYEVDLRWSRTRGGQVATDVVQPRSGRQTNCLRCRAEAFPVHAIEPTSAKTALLIGAGSVGHAAMTLSSSGSLVQAVVHAASGDRRKSLSFLDS